MSFFGSGHSELMILTENHTESNKPYSLANMATSEMMSTPWILDICARCGRDRILNQQFTPKDVVC